jgi:hypothetical protein
VFVTPLNRRPTWHYRSPALSTVLFWAIAISICGVIFGPNLTCHIQLSLRPELINDDARQQIVPFFHYEDSRVFRDDYLNDYYFNVLPILYRTIYVIAAWFDSVTTISKVLPYVLFMVTVIAVALAAQRLSGKIGAVTSVVLVLGNEIYLQRLAGGLPRSFAFPIIALLLLMLVTGNVYGLVFLTCIAAGLYPVVSLICGICLVFWLLVLPTSARGQATCWSSRRRWAVVGLTALGSLSFLLPQTLGTRAYGGVIAATRLQEFPEIGPFGRYIAEDRAPFPPLIKAIREILNCSLFGTSEPWSKHLRDFVVNASRLNPQEITECIVAFGLLIWFVRSFRSNELKRLLLLPTCVVIGYMGACQIAPTLFLPQRYLTYTVPLITVLLFATAPLLTFSSVVGRTWQKGSQFAAALVLAPLLLVVAGRGTKAGGMSIVLPSDSVLLHAVQALPVDVLVAAWPSGIANDIPYVTRRRVFVSYETHQAFHVDYALEMRRRVYALIDAYSATTIEPLLRLNREFGVTHLVVQREFANGTVPPYFRPFDVAIERARRRLGGRTPIMQHRLDSAAVFRRGNVVVLSLERIAEEKQPN